MPESEKTDTEENFNHHCPGWSKLWEEKLWDVPGKPAKCSNGSEVFGDDNLFVE